MVLPSLTTKYHHAPYPSIDPNRPELSASGKVVVVTGGGTGIGAATALAFVTAGARVVALLGRRPQPLQESKSQIQSAYPSAEILTFPLDVTDEAAVGDCFASLTHRYRGIDVCINAAAYLSDQGTIAAGPVSEFWKAFEVNVKGGFIVAQQFLRNGSRDGSVLIGINSLIAHLPASIVEQCPASYASSKIALAKLYEYVASENPGVRCYSLHPGVVETEMAAKSDAMAPPQKDNPFLPRDEGKWRPIQMVSVRDQTTFLHVDERRY
ncbi:hypothetical protein A1O7_08970 [Cladophialophora yegresii CBS 114405]|uniref:Ketoreductase domain-containing protein n=1 Tax=Cladophialophora yegresii CBS 114405 TaxID=1182544 RepID=W9WBX9_9EURO|nr:uncharacterized protein A1O7_08970 [Cladophialophora yegresii CBS 114405]EXJ56039.1 hypothetical protein A1O7_08970 [Cladophialophora yegresii CBS 114405]